MAVRVRLSSSASVASSRAHTDVTPAGSPGLPNSTSRPRTALRVRRTAAGSNFSIQLSICRMVSAFDRGPHSWAEPAMAMSMRASVAGSWTCSVCQQIWVTNPRGNSPAARRAPTSGRRSRRARASCIWPAACQRFMVRAAPISLAAASQPSHAHRSRSSWSVHRRWVNSATAAKRRAAFWASARVALVIMSTSEASSASLVSMSSGSYICSILATSTAPSFLAEADCG